MGIIIVIYRREGKKRGWDGKSFLVCKGGKSLLMIDCYLVAPSASISVNDVFINFLYT
jgi:hypothetical protein